jgi:hypothetical protein
VRPAGNAGANQLFPALQTHNLDLNGSDFRFKAFASRAGEVIKGTNDGKSKSQWQSI